MKDSKIETMEEKHKQALKSFRYSVEDVLSPEHDDNFLLRWLKARNFNEEKAETMLRKSLTWRKQWRADTFLEHYQMPEVFHKYQPGGLLGHDKEGCPVWMLNSGCLDVKGSVASSTKMEFMRYQIWRFETLLKDKREQTKKLNKFIGKNIYIMDEEHLTVGPILNKPVLESLLNVFSVFEANYPETLKRCYIINVPKPFHVLYSFIKPLLSAETAEKVKMFGTDGWKEALLEEIDASVLPVHWGGTRVDETGDPRCPTVVNLGGPIPNHYYLEHAPRLADDPTNCHIIVPKREHKDVLVRVPDPNSVIQYEVETQENDLAIGLLYRTFDDEKEIEELVPSTRLETHRATEFGSYECTKSGTYVVRLDNTFSWFSAKKVTYRISVHPPSDKLISSEL